MIHTIQLPISHSIAVIRYETPVSVPPAIGRQYRRRPVAIGDLAHLLFIAIGIVCCAGLAIYMLIGSMI